mmetsp:Transcript_21207/g.44610  ORF Transcript_21207/g.44610 Transcript_21207/m.44610 type:complete len:122 (-) Transcript_21207:5-370(-)
MDNDDTIHTERRVVAATKNHKTSDGGDGVVIGLIDFPRGGTLGLDGQSIVLKTDDFVGVRNVPPETFHLVTFKNGNKSNKSNNNNNSDFSRRHEKARSLLQGQDTTGDKVVGGFLKTRLGR